MTEVYTLHQFVGSLRVVTDCSQTMFRIRVQKNVKTANDCEHFRDIRENSQSNAVRNVKKPL